MYTSDGRHAWFHLHGTIRPARSASEATKYKMKNSCPQWDSNPQPSDLKSDALPTELAGFVECCPFKWTHYIMYSRYQCIHYYKYENDKEQRICLVNVLFCVTYWNIYKCCTNSKETHKYCACFQHTNTAKHYLSLCFLYNIHIFQYVTQNSTFTRQITHYLIILVLITRLTLVLWVHVCNNAI